MSHKSLANLTLGIIILLRNQSCYLQIYEASVVINGFKMLIELVLISDPLT